jgi:DNA-binding CsgD family transcriptional regulator
MPASPALVAINETPASMSNVDTNLCNLVSQINTLHLKSGSSPPAELEEVLLDRDIEGFRYLLIRMPQVKARIRLSPREQEIVRMVAKGHPNKVIADVLNISSWTVCTHLRRIFAKLGVGSRAAMVAQLLEIGALAPDHRVPGTR